MKKIFLLSLFFILASFCYSKENVEPIYKRTNIYCDYDKALTDSIAVTLVPEGSPFKGFYIITTETFDVKKNISTVYNLFFVNKDVMLNYLLTIESFNKNVIMPSYKHFLGEQTKEDTGLFEYMDYTISLEKSYLMESYYFLYKKDLNEE